MTFFSAIGAVIEKITQYIPSKEEGRRNEIDKLEDERKRILLNDPCTVKSAHRIAVIDDKLRLLKKSAANK